MSTPTPRTDAVYLEHRYWANEDEATEAIEDLRDLARKLERELATEREKVRTLRTACERLRDCDWTITLPDRMDAVRDIARAALAATEDAAPKSDQNASKLNQTRPNPLAPPHTP
jgi:hypothetical protein